MPILRYTPNHNLLVATLRPRTLAAEICRRDQMHPALATNKWLGSNIRKSQWEGTKMTTTTCLAETSVIPTRKKHCAFYRKKPRLSELESTTTGIRAI